MKLKNLILLLTFLRYYLNNINKRDLILSVYTIESHIRLWNFNNFECLLNIQDIYKLGELSDACFININNIIYIIVGHYKFEIVDSNFEPIKILDLNGNIIKEINNSYNDKNDVAIIIEAFYDNKLSKNYIITGNIGYIKSYDYDENKLYHKYKDDDENKSHCSIIINNKDELVILIESCYDGNIRIWDFHLAKLLIKINVSKDQLNGICLWNSNYLLVGCDDNSIKVIDLISKKVISKLKKHISIVLTLKKIIHPKYGECLISQGFDIGQIKLWIKKN